jgi:hypothetical protein
MSSKQIKDLIDLIKKTKDKKEQSRLKKILKDLLGKTKNFNKVRSTIRRPKIDVKTGIKEQVEKLINPILDEFKDDKTIYEDLATTRKKQIEDLKKQLLNAKSKQEQNDIEEQLAILQERKDFADDALKAQIPIKDFVKIDDLYENIKPNDINSLREFQYALRKVNPGKLDTTQSRRAAFAIHKYDPALKPENAPNKAKAERDRKALFQQIDKEVFDRIQDEEERPLRQSRNEQGERQRMEARGQLEFAKMAQAIEDEKARRLADEKARIEAERQQRIEDNANEGIPDFGQLFGDGKQKRRKVKGGAGIEDYLSFFGNIPGGSQALSMIPGFGSILSPVFDLAQSASKIGSEIGKQIKGSPEKMSGDALSSLSPMKSLLPFSLPFGKGKMKKMKGGNISGMFNKVGELTPQLSGVIQKAPGAYGTLGALGNSQLGSISRVFGDIFSRFGLGKKPKRKVKGCGAVSMRGQDIPFSWYNEELTTNNIVGRKLMKSKEEMVTVRNFNQALNEKANIDQQNAVNQLMYAKLMYDVDKIQQEQKAEKENKRKVVKS